MIIGVPKEVKNNENRVGITPAGVIQLVENGHKVIIEQHAGIHSGYGNDTYLNAGAKIVKTAEEVFDKAELIVKVKEPQPEEYPYIKSHHVIFTYFHFASSKKLTEAMIKSKAVCIAYETVQKENGSLPLLTPMSQIAGRVSVQEGARFLLKNEGGRGVLLGGVPGVNPGYVVILGGGIVGTEAAKMAAGLGARVTIMDINLERLNHLSEVLPANVKTLHSNEYNIERELKKADLIIGAVLIPGGKAPRLVKKKHLKIIKKGSVLIDVAVDQGGCIETCEPTTFDNPIKEIDGILHYGVSNIPGSVPFTSTNALTSATLPYIVQIANYGWVEACHDNKALHKGLSLVEGNILCQKVADTFGFDFSKKEY